MAVEGTRDEIREMNIGELFLSVNLVNVDVMGNLECLANTSTLLQKHSNPSCCRIEEGEDIKVLEAVPLD
jgi:hypothetical protein